MIPSTRNIQRYISYFQEAGTLLAMVIATIGGLWFLQQHGSDPLQIDLFDIRQPISFIRTFQDLQSATPLGLVELGLSLLIATQILRVAWLLFYYITVKDGWFVVFTAFILCAILYSLLWIG